VSNSWKNAQLKSIQYSTESTKHPQQFKARPLSTSEPKTTFLKRLLHSAWETSIPWRKYQICALLKQDKSTANKKRT